MIKRAAFAFINHLLGDEAWARARLRPFAGQRARFEIGTLALVCSVGGDGRLEPAAAEAAAEVCVRLPDDAPLRLLTDRAGLFAAARIEGAADFAEALGFVARHLRWDVEADLARVIGDVAAHRLATTGRDLATAQREAGQRMLANVGEYLGRESGATVRRTEAEAFAGEIGRLRDELARLEQRLARL